MAGRSPGGPFPLSRAELPEVAAAENVAQLPEHLRVLELFAGIGGWRLALEAVLPAGVAATISPYDSSPHCAEVYEGNFGERCSRRNVETLEPDVLEGFDLWLMSPPCQPFSTTREARQQDLKDKRCAALEHLCRLLPRLARPPRWVAFENVKGFARSDAEGVWHASLRQAGFSFRECLLDLASFGTPNHRSRYYLLAERSGRFAAGLPAAGGGPADRPGRGDLRLAGLAGRGPWAASRRLAIEAAHREARLAEGREAKDAVFLRMRRAFCAALLALAPTATSHEGVCLAGALLWSRLAAWRLLPMPLEDPEAFLLVHDDGRAFGLQLLAALQVSRGYPGVRWAWLEQGGAGSKSIAEFLEDEPNADASSEFLVPREVLARPFARGLSYVRPEDSESFCFTGHYGKVLHKSSGSLLLLHRPRGCAEEAARLDKSNPTASFGSVRFFTPKEVLNMLGFPRQFALPPSMQLRHRFKVVGNSLAVTVAQALLRVLLLGEPGGEPGGWIGRLEQSHASSPGGQGGLQQEPESGPAAAAASAAFA